MNPDRPNIWKKEVVLLAKPNWNLKKVIWEVERTQDGPAYVEEKYLFSPEIVNSPLFNALTEEKEENDDTN